MALTSKFSWKAGAAGLAAALSMLPGAAQADDQARPETTRASFTTVSSSDIPLTKDADGDALLWARENDGIAVAVYLGTSPSTHPPETIARVLQSDFEQAGVENVRFFFSQDDTEVTTVSYMYGNASDGIFTLGQSRAAVPAAADQYLFYKQHPELGF